MSEPLDETTRAAEPGGAASPFPHTLAEDVLLTLFEPKSGTIAGEGTLFYVLGGAVLAELAQNDLAGLSGRSTLSGLQVEALGDTAPADPVLGEVWESLREKPQGVQGLIAGIGPRLRGVLIDRLVERGDLREEERRILGFIPSSALILADSTHRDDLITRLRAVLVDGAEPDARTGALAGLLSASNSLSSLYREIPWSGVVHDRGKRMEQGDWGAAAAGEAVQRTIAAIITASVVGAVTAATTSSGN